MHLENEVKTGNKSTWGDFETRWETELLELSFRIGLNDKEILSITAFKRCAKHASVREETPHRFGRGGRLWASCSSRSWTNAGISMVSPAVLGCKTPYDNWSSYLILKVWSSGTRRVRGDDITATKVPIGCGFIWIGTISWGHNGAAIGGCIDGSSCYAVMMEAGRTNPTAARLPGVPGPGCSLSCPPSHLIHCFYWSVSCGFDKLPLWVVVCSAGLCPHDMTTKTINTATDGTLAMLTVLITVPQRLQLSKDGHIYPASGVFPPEHSLFKVIILITTLTLHTRKKEMISLSLKSFQFNHFIYTRHFLG